MHPGLYELTARERYKDYLREANNERLVREALGPRPRRQFAIIQHVRAFFVNVATLRTRQRTTA